MTIELPARNTGPKLVVRGGTSSSCRPADRLRRWRVRAAKAAVAADTDSGVDWTSIAIGAGAGLLAVAALAGLNSRRMRRLHRPGAAA